MLEALRTFEEEVDDGDPMPGLMESPGMSVDRVRAFADAAAAFFAAQPWGRLTNEDLLAVESERAPRNMRFVCVLGQEPAVRPLVLRFPARLRTSFRGDRRQPLCVAGERRDLRHDRRAALRRRGCLAGPRAAGGGPDAYPLAADMGDGSVRRPTLAGSRSAKGCCGRWRRRRRTSSMPAPGRRVSRRSTGRSTFAVAAAAARGRSGPADAAMPHGDAALASVRVSASASAGGPSLRVHSRP